MSRLIFLTIGMFTVGSSSFMIAGLLPKIGHSIAQPISIASQGITAFTVTYLFFAPLFSILLENQSAKRMLQLALTLFLVGNLITLSAHSLLSFIMGRIVTGLGASIFNPLCASVAIELAGPQARGRALSFVWGANSAGVVFGVPFGIFLSSYFDWRFSIGYVFLLGLVALIGFSFQRSNVRLPNDSSIKDRIRLLVDKDVLSVIRISTFTSLGSLGLYSYVSVIHHGAPQSLAVSLFFWGLGGFFGSSTVGHFIDKTKQPRVVMAYLLMGLLVSILSLPFTKNVPYLGLLSFFLWGAFGWATPTPQQHILFALREKHKAVLSALNSSALGLGGSLGTAIGGIFLASGFNANHLPFIASFFLLMAIFGQLRLVRTTRHRGAIT